MSGKLRRAPRSAAPPRGLTALALVVATCLVLSVVGWLPLALPGRLLRQAISGIPFTDSGAACGPAGYLCGVETAALAILPAIVFTLILYLLRRQLTRWVARLIGSRIPAGGRFLVAPGVATLGFTMSWGYVHAATPFADGIVPELIFPAVVGLFTYLAARYGALLIASGLFDGRERWPLWARLVAMIVIPTILSVALTSRQPITAIDLKQQLIVLASLVIGFLILAPARRPGNCRGRRLGYRREGRPGEAAPAAWARPRSCRPSRWPRCSLLAPLVAAAADAPPSGRLGRPRG